MKLALAMLGDGAETADLKADVAEMEKMLGGYLAFARGEGREPPAEIDLRELLGKSSAPPPARAPTSGSPPAPSWR